jgi:hypothetical protein
MYLVIENHAQNEKVLVQEGYSCTNTTPMARHEAASAEIPDYPLFADNLQIMQVIYPNIAF